MSGRGHRHVLLNCCQLRSI